MIPILFKENRAVDDTINDENNLIGNLVAQVAASYQFAKQSGAAEFTYNQDNLFSAQSGTQKITDANGKCRIDCSGFVGLVLRGITFANSPFATRKGTANATWNPSSEPMVYGTYGWEYTEFDDFPTSSGYNNIGISGKRTLRYAADIAKYLIENDEAKVLYDCDINDAITYDSEQGYSIYENKYLCEILQPGDLICWAKDGENGRYRTISHIGIVAERTSYYFQSNEPATGGTDTGIYFTKLDADHIPQIELIIRPRYRARCNDAKPTSSVNLINYPPRWGTSVESTSDSVTYKYTTEKQIKLNGTKPGSNSDSNRYLRTGATVNDYFIKDCLIELIPGEYTLSLDKISGTLQDWDSENSAFRDNYTGDGFSIYVSDSQGYKKATATLAVSGTLIVNSKSKYRIAIHIGKYKYKFTDLIIEPKLVLTTAYTGRNNTSKEKVAHLTDAETCKVTEERNGSYLLEMTYPVAGKYFHDIENGMFVKAKPNHNDENQFFRINDISKPLDGLVTISAKHISYDLSGYPIKKFKASSINCPAAIASVLGACQSYISINNPFRLGRCDIATLHSVDFEAISARAALGGVENSILDRYGGEFHFDNYKINLLQHRGADNGVRIAYGKNLVGMKLQINTDSSYTGLFPYCYDNDKNLITLDEGTLYVTNESNIPENVLMLDCSSLFNDDQEKNKTNLRTVANQYLADNDINEVIGTMEVEMLDLSKSVANGDYAKFEAVGLCDTVKVYHSNLDVNVSLKVNKTVYNSLSERYEKLELGTAKSSMADTVAQANKQAEKALNNTNEGISQLSIEFQQEIDDMSKAITGASGGHVVLNPSQNPQEILILCDSDQISTATKLWRWNSAGLAYGSHGYNGTYDFSILGDDGKLIISEVTASIIDANLIRTGSIISANSKVTFNLDYDYLKFTEGGYVSIEGSRGKAKLADGHIDFSYDGNFSFRLGQSSNRDFTIETMSNRTPTTRIKIDPYDSAWQFNSDSASLAANVIKGRNALVFLANNGASPALTIGSSLITMYGNASFTGNLSSASGDIVLTNGTLAFGNIDVKSKLNSIGTYLSDTLPGIISSINDRLNALELA